MYYVYILKLANGDYYAGSTNNLRTRFNEHNDGHVSATKNYLPCKLVSYLSFSEKIKALKFEKYLKTGSGYAFRNKRLI